MRDATPEERESINKYIETISEPISQPGVSRSSLRDIISKLATKGDSRYGRDSIYGEAVYDFAYEITKSLSLVTLQPRTGWIPVSERLPESSGVYIVSRWFSDGEESAILVDANYYDGNGDWYNDNRINWGRDLVTDKIVAWMSLPQPYKEE